jgi:uncharacterized membrane protein
VFVLTSVAVVVTVGLLVAVLRIALSSRQPVRPGSPTGRRRRPVGGAVGRVLSLLTIATVLTTTDVVPAGALAHLGAAAVLATAIGAALAPALTDQALAGAGVVLALADTARRYGAATAVTVLVIAILGLWVTGLIRRLTGGK